MRRIAAFILCLLPLVFSTVLAQVKSQASANEHVALVEAQLKAYNNRDIEAFLLPYSDSVKVFTFPDKLQYKGKTKMRESYAGMFNDLPDLHCKLVNRIQLGKTIIDQEQVTLRKGAELLEALAIYKIGEGKIQEVYFVFQ